VGLRSDIQRDIAAAFNGDLADAVVSFSLQVLSHSYDPSTGDNTETVVSTVSSRGVWDKISKERLVDSAYRSSDSTILVLQNELDAVPQLEDTVVHGVSLERYYIVSIESDPAQATWDLVVRKGDD
jgi:hypothetical protein